MTTPITIKVGEKTDNYCDNRNERTEPISLKEIRTQDRAAIHASLVAAVKNEAYKPWNHYDDIPGEGEVEVVNLEDLLTIINSIFKE